VPWVRPPGWKMLFAVDKAVDIAGKFDSEVGSDVPPEADVFCPECGGARTSGGTLGDPGFRWCRTCGARWRLSSATSTERLNIA